MPTLVHITDEKNSARIERSGIALACFRHKNASRLLLALRGRSKP
jgi:hypothetical protein